MMARKKTAIEKLRDLLSEKGDACFYREDGEPDQDRARRYFMAASLLGDPYSTFRLGYMSERGIGCRCNFEKALKHYKKAFSLGDYDSLVCIGDLYRDGKLGPADSQEALRWYHIAASMGHGFGALKEMLLKDELNIKL